MCRHITCVFGSNNALNPQNHIYHARLEAAWHLPVQKGATLAIFGRHQPSMKDTTLSEAETGYHYLKEKYGTGPKSAYAQIVHHSDESIKSVSATCAAIVERYLTDPETHIHLVMNWPHILRTYYLLMKQAKRAGLSWSELKPRVHLVPCGGTFVPQFSEKGLKAIPHWLIFVFGRECGAWLKALLDPYDEHLNQNRTAFGA